MKKYNYPKNIIDELVSTFGIYDMEERHLQILSPEFVFDTLYSKHSKNPEDMYQFIVDVYGVTLKAVDPDENQPEFNKNTWVRGFGNILRAIPYPGNAGIRSMELDEHDIVTIKFTDHSSSKANTALDSPIYTLLDIIKKAL